MKKKIIFLSTLLTLFTVSCRGKPSIIFKDDEEIKLDKDNNKTDNDKTDNDKIDNVEQGENEKPTIRKDFSKLFYRTEDYMSGVVEERIIYFHENYFLHQNFDINNEREEISRHTFTEEEKTAFIDSIYEAGLLNIDNEYINDNAQDGGEWKLWITFHDGDDFVSSGVNDGPYDVFGACAVAFYNLCGEEVFPIPVV